MLFKYIFLTSFIAFPLAFAYGYFFCETPDYKADIRAMFYAMLFLIFLIGKEEWKNDWKYKDGMGLGKFILYILFVIAICAVMMIIEFFFSGLVDWIYSLFS